LFQQIDAIAEANGVCKIETVSKTYMACAGLTDSEKQLPIELIMMSHARRCVEMGLDILRLVKTIKLKNGEQLQVKIGINTGPVTAGVVGFHKP
jgi:class 3 adenylate cyclase